MKDTNRTSSAESEDFLEELDARNIRVYSLETSSRPQSLSKYQGIMVIDAVYNVPLTIMKCMSQILHTSLFWKALNYFIVNLTTHQRWCSLCR